MSVSIAFPEAMSELPGVYTGLTRVSLLNVPLPEEVHLIVRQNCCVPFKVNVPEAHIVDPVPADTAGSEETFTFNVKGLAAVQL